VSVAHPGPAVVELRLSARPALIPTVRTVASDLAGRADFDLDAISDLRMAVDEACTTLVRLTTEEDMLTCVFTLSDDSIGVKVTARAAWAGAKVSTESFGWRVLQTLADEVVAYDGDEGVTGAIAIGLVKRSGAVQ
jgi:serine/threonine-protein kinase RsbW